MNPRPDARRASKPSTPTAAGAQGSRPARSSGAGAAPRSGQGSKRDPSTPARRGVTAAQSTMRHKGYTAKVVYDDEGGVLRGEVIDLQDEITFQAGTVAQLRREFHAAVDGYLLDCATRGVEPAKPFSGRLLLRLPADLHRRAAITAAALDVSLNDFLVGSIEVGVTRINAARTTPGA